MDFSHKESFKSHRDKVQMIDIRENYFKGKVSNPIGTKFKCRGCVKKYSVSTGFKSHRDKVQIKVVMVILML